MEKGADDAAEEADGDREYKREKEGGREAALRFETG